MIDYSKMWDMNRIGLAAHAKRQPEHIALIMNDRRITYGELEEMTNSLAKAFTEMGVSLGDRVSTMFHNSPEILIVWAALGKMGATPISINYRFKENELAYVLNHSETRLLIYGHEFTPLVHATRPKLINPDMVHVVSGQATANESLCLEDLMAKGSKMAAPAVSVPAGVANSLIYTSGTTGRPKGVFRNSRNRLNTLLGYAYLFESTYDDTHLVAGPLYHSAPYGWAIFSMLLGNTVVIMPRFDAENFLRLVQENRATTTWVVPTMLNRILALPADVLAAYDISSLRVMVEGGESCPYPLKRKAVEFFSKSRIFEFFGATEISAVTFLRPEDQLRKPGSCGQASPGNEIKLFDEDFHEVPVGQVGIMYVKSDFLLDGYYNDPTATAANYHEDYFTVGDMARRDEEGYYYIVNRAVDMVISGGVNIYPVEIEEVLLSHPAVFDAAIIGAKDPDWGEKLVAFVVIKENVTITEKEIIDYIGQKMADYKKPKEVYFVAEIPYSPAGKQLKRVLRAEYEKSRGIEAREG